jgi:DNA-binding XRE family transcriptional regulator
VNGTVLAGDRPDTRQRAIRFGQTIRAHRRWLGLTQPELADRIGCHRQSILRWEHAQWQPSLTAIFRLADAFGVPAADLFTDETPPGETR